MVIEGLIIYPKLKPRRTQN